MIKTNKSQILRIAIPLMFQQLCLQAQMWVDRAMLGRIDTGYFDAIGSSLLPYNTIVAIIGALCAGTTIFVAQRIGANNTKEGKEYAESSFLGNSLLPLMSFLFFFFCSEYMFMLMGVEPHILPLCTSYMKIISFSLLILGPTQTALSITQGAGAATVIMFTGIANNAVKIIADWILIFGKFGAPRLEIKGAALATVIAAAATAPIPIVYIFKSRRIPFKLKISDIFRFKIKTYGKIFRLALPNVFELLLWNGAALIGISFLNRLGGGAAGIFAQVMITENLPVIFYLGFANASLTLVGQQAGAGAQENVIKTGLGCIKFGLIICCFISPLFMLFPDFIVGLFTDDKAFIEKAAPYLRIISVSMFPKALNNVVGQGIRGLGDTKWMLGTQILGAAIVVTVSYLLIFPAGLGILGIFLAMFADETVRSILNLLRFRNGREFFRRNSPPKETKDC